MTIINVVTKTIAKSLKKQYLAKKLAAVLILIALLIPIASPVPAWAYSASEPAPFSGELEMSNLEGTLAAGVMSFADTAFAGLLAYIVGSGGDKRETKKEKGEYIKNLASRVARIKTEIKTEVTLAVGQSLPLSALPLDQKGRVVNGVGSQWYSTDRSILGVSEDQAIANEEGTAQLIVKAGNASTTINVTVISATSEANKKMQPPPMPDVDPEVYNSLFTARNNLGKPQGQVEARPRTALRRCHAYWKGRAVRISVLMFPGQRCRDAVRMRGSLLPTTAVFGMLIRCLLETVSPTNTTSITTGWHRDSS